MLMINLAERLLLSEFRHASQGHLNISDWKKQKRSLQKVAPALGVREFTGSSEV